MNTEKKPTQLEKLEAELTAGKKLTSLDIIGMNILNYKGRIWDLRRKGLNITTKMVKTSGGSEIAQYYLTPSQLTMSFKN